MSGFYKIRNMSREEMDIVIDWAAKEGWNPGIYDADTFYATDPKGFFMGFVNNKPISCISAVAYNDHFGFLGFYIVRPEYRNQGYGWEIWKKALNHLPTQNIGLDGVVTQQENYKKSGFKLAYRNIRYQGKSKKFNINNTKIVELLNVEFAEILKYDSSFFPAPRPQFLKCWINLPESTLVGYVRTNKLLGYGVIRKCRVGYKIGPLFADDQEKAEELFLALNNHISSGSPIFLDVPEVNPSAVILARKHNMNSVFETARMYTKKPPDLPLQKIFGITTFELG